MFSVKVTLFLLGPTFLGDADGATAHAHTQPIHTSINQILGLSCCHHCRGGAGRNSVRMGCPHPALGLPRTPNWPPSPPHLQ